MTKGNSDREIRSKLDLVHALEHDLEGGVNVFLATESTNRFYGGMQRGASPTVLKRKITALRQALLELGEMI